MSLSSILNLQENPDGISGHLERELIREELDPDTIKRKFTGKAKPISEFTIIQAKQQKELSKQIADAEKKQLLDALKKRCMFAKMGCHPKNCQKCKKRLKKNACVK
jgi:hypothetical protein